MKKTIFALILIIVFFFTGCDMLEESIAAYFQNKRPKESHILKSREKLILGDFLISKNKLYVFKVQEDSNLVVTNAQTNNILWQSKTEGTNAKFLVLGRMGNLKLVGDDGKIWETATNKTGKYNYLRMNEDGSLVLYAEHNKEVWRANDPEGEYGDVGIHVVGYSNYLKENPEEGYKVDIERYPRGIESGDCVLMIVIGEGDIITSSDWIPIVDGTINSFLPQELQTILGIPDEMKISQYITYALNGMPTNSYVESESPILVHMTGYRGVGK